MAQQITLGNFIGTQQEEDFLQFDLTDAQEVLQNLSNTEAIDLAHAEMLQQQSLRCADLLTEYLGKIVKTVGYLEAKANSAKNKASLEYQHPEGRTTMEMRKWAGEASSEVEALNIKLATAKGSKLALEKKYDLLVKAHHHYKDIAQGLRRTILGYGTSIPASKIPEGYE
jgi:hypothetical protein